MIKESRIAREKRRKEEKRKDRASRQAKRKLSIEKIVMMMLNTLGQYPNILSLKYSYNVSKSCGYRHRVCKKKY
ncbi:hypothetical protein AGMMS49921_07780 [Endomicrobiia bacterium]|nr:hypothetical protein AGMMS49921_07780 [Endomicrobiia bacterium]